ncbi:MAG: hypothetical protein ABIN57_03035 [Chitinophagaceae bacterium]
MSFFKRIITAIPFQTVELKKSFNKNTIHQKLIDAGLITLISVMIVVYKAFKV